MDLVARSRSWSTLVDGVGLDVTVTSVDGRSGFGYVADRDLISNL